MARVKICGIRRVEDALLAAHAGAHAVGLLVGQRHASPDFVDERVARTVVEALPPFCSSVLVTHLTDAGEIAGLAGRIGVSTIQLHGGSTPQTAAEIKSALPYRIKLIQAVHVAGLESVEAGRPFVGVVDALLLDTANPATGQVGGTGLTHDWGVSRAVVEAYGMPVLLAGGLHPLNVARAIREVGPYGVDVNSGVKGPDGFKDAEKVRAFVKAAADE